MKSRGGGKTYVSFPKSKKAQLELFFEVERKTKLRWCIWERGRAREGDCTSDISLAPSSGGLRNRRFLQTGSPHENGSFLMHLNIFIFYWWNQVKEEVSGFLLTDILWTTPTNLQFQTLPREKLSPETSWLSDTRSKTTKGLVFMKLKLVMRGGIFTADEDEMSKQNWVTTKKWRVWKQLFWGDGCRSETICGPPSHKHHANQLRRPPNKSPAADGEPAAERGVHVRWVISGN